MNIETAAPLNWLRQLPGILYGVDTIPLWGNPPPFPWSDYSHALSDLLRIPHLKITAANFEWLTSESLFNGLGENPMIVPFQASPLEGKGLWILPREDLKGLLKVSLVSESELSDLENEEWLEEFYEFIFLEAVQALHKIKFDLTPQILSEVQIPEKPCMCIDLEIETDQKTLSGRLAISPEMQQSFSKKYASHINAPEAIPLTVQLIAGQVELDRKSWNECRIGDFIMLDSCYLTLENDKGRVVLTVNDTPLFRGKIKDGNIKILEYPSLQEVHQPMIKHNDPDNDENDEEEDDDDMNFSEEEFTEEFTEDEELEDEDDEFVDEELTENETAETEGKEPSQTEEIEGKAQPLAKSSAAPVEKAASQLTENKTQPLMKLEEIPLTIAVEVGRFQMNVKQLMELSPGNILELSIHPENGVDLVVSGRCIGRGELLKIGDTLGVRILDKA